MRLAMMVVRLIVSGFVLVKIYHETGPWTAVFLGFGVVAFELVTVAIDKMLDSMKKLGLAVRK